MATFTATATIIDQTLIYLLTTELDQLFLQNLTLDDLDEISRASDYVVNYIVTNFGNNYFNNRLLNFRKQYSAISIDHFMVTKYISEISALSHINFDQCQAKGVVLSSLSSVDNINNDSSLFQSINGSPAITAIQGKLTIEIYLVNGSLVMSYDSPAIVVHKLYNGHLTTDKYFVGSCGSCGSQGSRGYKVKYIYGNSRKIEYLTKDKNVMITWTIPLEKQ